MYLGFTIPVYCYNRARSINTLLECLEKNSYLHHDVLLIVDSPKTPPSPGEMIPNSTLSNVWELLDKKWRHRDINNMSIRVSFKQNAKNQHDAVQRLEVVEAINYGFSVALSSRVAVLGNPDFYLSPNWDYNLVKYGMGRKNIVWGADLYYDYTEEIVDEHKFIEQSWLPRPLHYYTFPYKDFGNGLVLNWSRVGYPECCFSEQDFLNYAAKTSVSPNVSCIVSRSSPPLFIQVFDKDFFIQNGGFDVRYKVDDYWGRLASTLPNHYKFVSFDSVALTYHCDLKLHSDITTGPQTPWFIPLKPEYSSVIIRTKENKACFYDTQTLICFASASGNVITVKDDKLFQRLREASLEQFAAITCAMNSVDSITLVINNYDKITSDFSFCVEHKLDESILRNPIGHLPSQHEFFTSSDPAVSYTKPIPICDMTLPGFLA